MGKQNCNLSQYRKLLWNISLRGGGTAFTGSLSEALRKIGAIQKVPIILDTQLEA